MFNLAVDKQISLHTFHPDDAEDLFKLLKRNLSHLRPWIHPSVLPATAKAARIFTIECLLNSFGNPMDAVDSPYFQEVDHYSPPPNPPLELGIWICDNLAGAISLSRLQDSLTAAEIGYWVTAKQEGKGIIMRCVSALMDYAIDNMKIERFVITCAASNQRSRAVAERLGYRLHTTIPNGEVVGEFIYDQVIYGIRSNAWRERNKTNV